MLNNRRGQSENIKSGHLIDLVIGCACGLDRELCIGCRFERKVLTRVSGK